MNCEMCGAQTNLNKYRVEGVQMSLCSKCGQHGIREKESKKSYSFQTKTHDEPEIIELIKENYANIIKNAREKTGLKQKELAQKISERESLIHNVESGHMKPSIKLANKLEQFLGINLIMRYKEDKENQNQKRSVDNDSEGFTIGDLIKKR